MAGKSLNLKRSLGNRIRKLRKERGLKQKDLAEMADISEKYISSLETGAASCSLAVLVALANSLNTSIDYLLVDFLKNNELNKHDEPLNELVVEAAKLSDVQVKYLTDTARLLKTYDF